jgi:hypothetical protein
MGDDRGICLIEVNPGALAVAFSYESGFEALWFTIQSRLMSNVQRDLMDIRSFGQKTMDQVPLSISD